MLLKAEEWHIQEISLKKECEILNTGIQLLTSKLDHLLKDNQMLIDEKNQLKFNFEQEIDALRYQLKHLDEEILHQNGQMHDIRVDAEREVKEVREDLLNMNKQLDFEVRDKKQELLRLRQELHDSEYQLADSRQHCDKLDKLAHRYMQESDQATQRVNQLEKQLKYLGEEAVV